MSVPSGGSGDTGEHSFPLDWPCVLSPFHHERTACLGRKAKPGPDNIILAFTPKAALLTGYFLLSLVWGVLTGVPPILTDFSPL